MPPRHGKAGPISVTRTGCDRGSRGSSTSDDTPGPRIAAGQKAPCSLFLTRSRKRATRVRVPTTAEFEHMLRGASLRVTRPLVAVLLAVHHHPHPDSSAIISAVRDDLVLEPHPAA